MENRKKTNVKWRDIYILTAEVIWPESFGQSHLAGNNGKVGTV
jgi:hypothetical protein